MVGYCIVIKMIISALFCSWLFSQRHLLASTTLGFPRWVKCSQADRGSGGGKYICGLGKREEQGMTLTRTAEVGVAGVCEDVAGYEVGGVLWSQTLEDLVAVAKGFELYPEGKVESLEDLSVTFTVSPISSLTLDYMLKLIICSESSRTVT